MHKRKTGQRVGLRQREGRARDFDTFIGRKIADQRSGECGLAGAEISGQRDQIARLNQRGNIRHQTVCGCLVGERDRKAITAGAGGKHQIIRCSAAIL